MCTLDPEIFPSSEISDSKKQIDNDITLSDYDPTRFVPHFSLGNAGLRHHRFYLSILRTCRLRHAARWKVGPADQQQTGLDLDGGPRFHRYVRALPMLPSA